MARIKKIDLDAIPEVRKKRGENQRKFWGRFHVTQSGGSRYENTRSIPEPTALLVGLYLLGKIDDEDLKQVARALSL